jgi:hypothetical protein
MNWFKENPFLAGLSAVAAVGAAVLGYLIFQASSAFTAATDTYTASVSELHALQNRVPFPSDENLGVLKGSLEDYTARISGLRQQMAKMEQPLPENFTPQQFQDALRAAVNETKEKAAAAGVELPENFYLGFNEYQTQVPPEKATPYLERQFQVIRTLVNRLIDFKVQSIDSLDRKPLSQESASGSQPAAAQPGQKTAAEPVVERFPFDLSFTAEQGKFRVAFNSLLGSDHFLVVRWLRLQNSSPNPPARGGDAGTAPPTTVGTDTPAPDAGAAGSNLQVILGREVVQATLRLEMLDFTEPPAPKN